MHYDEEVDRKMHEVFALLAQNTSRDIQDSARELEQDWLRIWRPLDCLGLRR